MWTVSATLASVCLSTITATGAGGQEAATPLVDVSRIVYTSVGPDGNHDVYSMRPDGSDVHRLTTAPAQDYGGPISPDGRWIAFMSERTGRWEVWLMRPDGSKQTQLTTAGGTNPAWSPGGRRIAFTDLQGVISVIGTDGSGLRTLRPGANPDWSPDGTRIAFLYPAEPSELYVMHPDGTHVRRLTFDPDLELSVDWSPNGRWLLFERAVPTPDGNYLADLWRIHPDGTGLQRITNDPAYESQARYAPVGQWIVLARTPERLWFEGYELYLMRPNGTVVRQLTTGVGGTSYNRDPYWGWNP